MGERVGEGQVHAPCPSGQILDIQVVLPLEGFAADFAHVFSLLAVVSLFISAVGFLTSMALYGYSLLTPAPSQ